MNRILLVLALAGASLAASGCSTGVCDRNAQLDLTQKAGACTGVPTAPLLGSASSCSANLAACSSGDQSQLTQALDCLQQVGTCTADGREAYLAALEGCTDQLRGLSQACKDAFFNGVLPGEDAGVDAGSDAGPQPIDDGGNGVELIAVADGTDHAFAWSILQAGDVAVWQLVGRDDQGARDPERELGPGATSDYLIADSGFPSHRYFVVGRDPHGEIASGNPDAGGGVDAGMAMCQRSLDCPVDRVCDLGQCKEQNCMLGSTTCPAGYQCLPPGTCTRTTSDAGTYDAGFARPDAGTINQPLPFISNEVALTSAPAGFSPGFYLGGFPARRPAIAAVDTARVFVSLEQEAQLVAHASRHRGKDFPEDGLSSYPLDTVGTRAKSTYNPDSKLTFICYNVGRGVRVQRSDDYGRTWGLAATTIEPPDDLDGGLTSTISDCDIAPWKNGGALVVTLEDGALMVRAISSALSVEAPTAAFLENPAGYFSPSHPAIATLHQDNLVHITFTAVRLSGGSQDSEPVAVYRDGTLGAFTQPQGLAGGATTNSQDWTAVAIDPKTKTALAAFTSVEPGPGGTPISTVYTSLWNPTSRLWGSGSDLNVFASQQNTTLLFPQKAPATDVWFAFSPSIAILPSGKIWLSFVVGPRVGSSGNYKMVAVPFDLELQSPLSTAKGWYVRPVIEVSQTRVLDPRGSTSSPQPPVSALAADHQLSIYGAFIEGLGASGEVEGRGIFFSRP